jgi:hypothetical protein
VKSLAAQRGLAGRRPDFQGAVEQLDHGHVERPAAEVEDEQRLVLAGLVEAVGDGRSRRFVQDALDRQPGDPAGRDGGLPLAVVEVRRDGDDGPGDGRAEERLGVGLQRPQDQPRTTPPGRTSGRRG